MMGKGYRKLIYLAEAEELGTEMGKRPMKKDIRPASHSELRRKLPCLETVIILKVVQGFEKVEH